MTPLVPQTTTALEHMQREMDAQPGSSQPMLLGAFSPSNTTNFPARHRPSSPRPSTRHRQHPYMSIHDRRSLRAIVFIWRGLQGVSRLTPSSSSFHPKLRDVAAGLNYLYTFSLTTDVHRDTHPNPVVHGDLTVVRFLIYSKPSYYRLRDQRPHR
ncbi:uncharacterized protein EDB91DRAFT_179539 [Suillus paluster]|uniref:uncharacterized protein n=1 Tax=Suillus paluster TaxID=48578 RepID=UPI001B86BE04|nr:uncharacterized protein EDB91DRAFT_179539 [Suillus paluster]KAG1723361.1 hypothetical protein EDB91DRAFT_179539 [Suillus paluster]